MTYTKYGTTANNAVKLTAAAKLPAVDGSLLIQTPYLNGDVFNARNYGASGRGEVATTGTIQSGATSVVVASATTWEVGQGICIAGAGSAGARLVTKVTAISGTTFTVRDQASTTVNNAVVTHSDHEAIQDTINACLYPGNSESAAILGMIYIPGGVFNLYETLNFGWGETFRSFHVFGNGPKFSGTYNFAGTVLSSFMGDRPAIAVNGCLTSSFHDLSVLGINRSWVQSRGLGDISNVTYDDINESDWIDTALTAAFPNCASRYAPYAGVAIDPYTGSQPATPYPNQPIPAWSSSQTQYGKTISSHIYFENVSIDGFVVGVAVKPSDDNNQGDYVQFSNCRISYNAYGVSIGNSQSRLISFDNSTISGCHTCITTATHGAQSGKPSIVLDNCEVGANIRIFYVPNTNAGGCLTMNHCYSEVCYRIGDFLSGVAQNPSPVSFNNCEFAFGWSTNGVPNNIIVNYGNTSFVNCSFGATMPAGQGSYPDVFHFHIPGRNLELDYCNFASGASASTYVRQHVVNASGGVTCLNLSNELQGEWTNGGRWNLNTGSLIGTSIFEYKEETTLTGRYTGMSMYGRKYMAEYLGTIDDGFPRKLTANLLDKSAVASYSSAGNRILTVSGIPNAYLTEVNVKGGATGDIVYCDESKAIYAIKAVVTGATTTEWTLLALTGYNADLTLKIVPSALSGYFYMMNARLYTPRYATFATLTSGSNILTAAGRLDGYAGYLSDAADGVAVDDYIQSFDETDLWNTLLGGKITAIDTGAKTITVVSAPQATAFQPSTTALTRRFCYFIRKPPSNNT